VQAARTAAAVESFCRPGVGVEPRWKLSASDSCRSRTHDQPSIVVVHQRCVSATFEDMEVSNLIDVDLWNRARWNSVAFTYQPDRPPFLALAFVNREAGEQIFRHLRGVTGGVDTFELIRIAFIEGDIPGKPPGYTVLICPNFEGLVAKARAEGREPPDDVAMIASFSRMSPTPESRSLHQFKQEVSKHGRYFLVGASISDRSIAFGVAIEKTLVVFKHVSEIGQNDIDRLIFAREAKQQFH
jgi:hypothetical protein